MVAIFLRLKLLLLWNQLKRSIWQAIGVIIGVLYALGIAGGLFVGLIATRWLPDDRAPIIGAFVALAATAVGVGHLVVPLLFGADDSFAPQRFILFGLPPRRLALGLGAAAFLNPAALAEFIVLVGFVAAASRTLLGFCAGVISAAALLVMVAISARIVVASAQFLFTGRRSRELLSLIGFVLMMTIGVIVSLVVQLAQHVPNPLALAATIGNYLSWTPWGAAAALPFQLAGGSSGGTWMMAIGRLLIVLLGVIVVALLWELVVRRASRHSVTSQSSVKSARGLGAFERAASEPRAVIAARSATYWARDNRYRAALLAVVLLPFIFGAVAMLNGASVAYVLVGVCIAMVFFVSYTASNEFAYDNTAFAQHVLTGVQGRADVPARLRIPAMACAVLSVLAAVLAVAFGHGELAWVAFAVSIGVAGTGLGASAVLMSLLPYAAVPPGGNPMKTPKGAGPLSMASQGVIFFVVLVVVVPAFVGIAIGEWSFASVSASIGAFVSLVLGCVFASLGMRFGARIYDRRQLKIFRTIVKYASGD